MPNIEQSPEECDATSDDSSMNAWFKKINKWIVASKKYVLYLLKSNIMQLGNALNWFEIPVMDFERAKKFYEAIFSYQMPENTMGPARMGFLLYDFPGGKVGGAIVHNPDFYTPSEHGSLIYLNCQPDLQIVLNRVNDAGGQTLIQKKEVAPGLGFWALIKDTEGNRVALHSME